MLALGLAAVAMLIYIWFRFEWQFDGGAVVSKHRQRLLPTAMEPRGVVVAPIAAAEDYTVYSSTQVPHILRVMLALTTGAVLYYALIGGGTEDFGKLIHDQAATR